MRESVIYQEIFHEGELKGRQEGELKGRQEGRQEGPQEGRQEEAAALILRILTHRFGEIPASVQAWLQQLTIEQLEALVDVALTAHSVIRTSNQ